MYPQRIFSVLILIVIFGFCAFIYTCPRIFILQRKSNDPGKNTTKTILYWNKFFTNLNFEFGEGSIASHCPLYNNCLATHNRSLQDIENFDALIFHGISGEFDPFDLPVKRRSDQKYVFVSLESPQNRFVNKSFDGFFNWTMTYHLDSDVVWTYSDIISKDDNSSLLFPPRNGNFFDHSITQKKVEKDEKEEERLDNLIKNKNKLAIWYRSNCWAHSAREQYVRKLGTYVKVDSFGKCSINRGCSRKQDCFKIDVEPNYFFYLSFENSFCDDYVTEKFFNALRHYVVPVVYGGAEYSKLAPPKSFINALDFDSPKDLAEYLMKLSRNTTEYKKYFEWKKKYVVVDAKQRIICDLCELLNTGKQIKTYKISTWYNNKNRCHIQNQLKKQRFQRGISYATRETLML